MSPVRRLRRNRIGALLELGEIRSLDVELLEDRVDAAGLHGVPYTNPALWFRCLRLILDGDVTLAEQHAQAMYEQSPPGGYSRSGAVHKSVGAHSMDAGSSR